MDLTIPTIVNADIKDAQAAQIKSYTFSNIKNWVYSSPFNVPNSNPLYINLRQWSTSSDYTPYTIEYTVFTHTPTGTPKMSSYSSSVYNYSGPAVYAQMSGAPVQDNQATLHITIKKGDQAYSGYGEIYQN